MVFLNLPMKFDLKSFPGFMRFTMKPSLKLNENS